MGLHTGGNADVDVRAPLQTYTRPSLNRGIDTWTAWKSSSFGWSWCSGAKKAATVGSILGAKFGADALPEKWVGVLNDRLLSCVRDCNDNRISELAERTHRVASAILSPPVEEAPAQPIADGDGGLPGTWKLDLEWGNLVLTVDADLSGRIDLTAFGETRPIRNVRIEGNKVRFTFAMPRGDYDMDIEFDGTVRGARLTGVCASAGFEFSLNGVRS